MLLTTTCFGPLVAIIRLYYVSTSERTTWWWPPESRNM